jgi:cytochrome c biogenesis protein CcdA
MDVLATVLPLALVVGLSPLPIVPVVLLLMAPRARATGPAFLAAWVLVLTALVVAALLLAGVPDPGGEADETVGWIELLLGVGLLAAGLAKWVRRPRPGEPKQAPGWMASLDAAGPQRAATLGALLAINPKNLLMALAAGTEVALLAQGATQAAGAVALFVLVGSLGVGTPVALRLLLGERADPALGRARGWLDRNGTTVGVVVLLVLGVVLVVRAVPALG